jgi:xylulokinase
VTVGIDIGTTSVKAVAVDASGQVVDRVRLPHPLLVPAADRIEHDADRAWRRGPRRALRRLARSDPAAVAVASMVPSLTAVDRRGRPVAPGLLYGDARGRTGTGAASGDEGEGAGFLRWLAAEAPDAAAFWPAPAVANHALGGEAVVDIGSAFASAPLFGDGGWNTDLCAEVGVEPGSFPRVEMMGAPVGRVRDADAVLGAGCVDALCEQLVAGAATGDVHVICGTTLIVWALVDEQRDVPGLWATPHPATGGWSLGGASNAGGLFVGWASGLLGRVTSADQVDPARVPVWSPYVRGERTPLHDPDRRASLHGLDLTHGPAALQRAAWEASGFVVRHHLDLAGVEPRRVVATGGGTRVDGWMQALADCTNLPVHVAAVPDSAAVGAAWLARMALGQETGFDGAARWARTDRIVEPDPVWSHAATERYRLFRALADTKGTPE